MNKFNYLIIGLVSLVSAVLFNFLQGKISNLLIMLIILAFGYGVGSILEYISKSRKLDK